MPLRFCGQPLSAEQLELIEGITRSCPGVSRTELAATVCELLGWRRANGRLKSRECWALLEQLEDAGKLRLPSRRQTKPKGARTSVPRTARGEPGETLCAPLGELTPLIVTRVETPEQHRLWRDQGCGWCRLGCYPLVTRAGPSASQASSSSAPQRRPFHLRPCPHFNSQPQHPRPCPQTNRRSRLQTLCAAKVSC